MASNHGVEIDGPSEGDTEAVNFLKCKSGKNVDEDPVCRSQACINSILTDDSLRAVLSKLSTQTEKDNYGLVCKRWLMLQSTERRRIAARAGPFMLQKIAVRFTSIVELDFAQSVSRSFYPGVTDTDLETIAANFQNLERINLQECKGITDTGVKALAKGIPALRSVILSDCRKLTDKGVEALANACTKLMHLHVARCKLVSDKSLEYLSRFCKELESLNLSGCISISDKGLQSLNCIKLQDVDLSKCGKVGDSGVSSLVSLNTCLRRLNLCDCSKLTDLSISLVAQHCKNMSELLLGGCTRLTNTSIEHVARGCGQLKALQIDWCREITDTAITAVLSCCNLERLDMQCCTGITDEAMRGLEFSGSGLRELRLNHCPNLSGVAVERIVGFCGKLEILELKCCGILVEEAAVAVSVALRLPVGCKLVLR